MKHYLLIVLETDDALYPQKGEEGEWFRDHVLGDDLVLVSRLVGDDVGAVRVMRHLSRSEVMRAAGYWR